jgi:hypothetical protein
MKQSADANASSLNPWDYKPWWCQPWSILLTGMSLISGSWFFFEKIWLTSLIAVPIGAWMGFFLLIWPQLMKEQYSSTSEETSRTKHP